MSEKTDHCSKYVYGQVEDNNAYQELGEITRETQYDKLYWQNSNISLYQFCSLELEFTKPYKIQSCSDVYKWWHKSSYTVW